MPDQDRCRVQGRKELVGNTLMNYIALDLEMNQPSNKIIEVGVAIGNITDGIITTKNWYIDPKESIEEYITNLTGISNHTIAETSSSIEDVARDLSELILKYNCFVNAVTWGQGDTRLLLQEFKENNVNFPHFGRRDLDIKTICVYHRLAQERKTTGGLSSFLHRYGLKFFGTPHRAANDAYNTLSLWFVLLKREQAIKEMISKASII